MRLLIQFSRRFLYRHPGQLLLALTGIAAGVAVVTGVALMRDVLMQSLDAAAEVLSGTDSLRIEQPGGPLDEQLFAELATTSGAPDLIPVLRTRARYGDQILEWLAIDPLSLSEGGPMRLSGPATGALVGGERTAMTSRRTLERLGLEVGDVITVRAGGADIDLELTAAFEQRRELDNRLIMDLANAQHLLGRRGELSWIEAPAEARDWLEEHLPEGLVLIDSRQRRDSAARLTQGMRTNLTALSLLGLAVGLFVVHAVLSFLLVQRRRQIGMARAIGVTRSQLGRLMIGETLVLAGLGALLGLVLGTWLADQLVGLVRAPAAELYGLVTTSHVMPTWPVYGLIFLLALVASGLSTASVLRAALNIPPGLLSRQSDGHVSLTRTTRLALVTVLATSGLAAIIFPVELAWVLIGMFLLLCACALLAPTLGMALIRAWQRFRPLTLSGRALGMLGAARQRLGPALAALSLALGLSAGIAMMVLGFRVAVDDWVERLLRADTYLTLSQGRIGPELFDELAQWPDIESLSSVRNRDLGEGVSLSAFDLPDRAWGGFELLAGDGDRAHEAFLAGEGVLVSEPLARHQQLQIGQTIDVPAPDHVFSATVVAIYRDYASDRGTIAMDGATYRELFDDPYRDSLGLYFADNIDRGALYERLAELNEAIVTTDRAAVRTQTLAVFDRTFRITWALAVLVGIIAAIALISALLALGLERGREYATLRALGLTRAGLARWVMVQTTSLAAAAALLAIPISLMIHAVLSLAVQPRAFGWSVGFTLPFGPWLVLIPLALLAGLLAGIYPAWKIARRDPAGMLKGSS
jgi:putative ABC transport system permease protein